MALTCSTKGPDLVDPDTRPWAVVHDQIFERDACGNCPGRDAVATVVAVGLGITFVMIDVP